MINSRAFQRLYLTANQPLVCRARPQQKSLTAIHSSPAGGSQPSEYTIGSIESGVEECRRAMHDILASCTFQGGLRGGYIELDTGLSLGFKAYLPASKAGHKRAIKGIESGESKLKLTESLEPGANVSESLASNEVEDYPFYCYSDGIRTSEIEALEGSIYQVCDDFAGTTVAQVSNNT